MNTKICTSIDQSNKLIKLGIDVNTADMYYAFLNRIDKYATVPTVLDEEKYVFIDDIPAWSLSALLELIHNKAYILRNSNVGTNRYNVWIAVRKSPVWSETPLDAAFEMVVWLKENGKYE